MEPLNINENISDTENFQSLHSMGFVNEISFSSTEFYRDSSRLQSTRSMAVSDICGTRHMLHESNATNKTSKTLK